MSHSLITRYLTLYNFHYVSFVVFLAANIRVVKNNGARSMTAFFDVLAGLSLAAQLNSAPINIQPRFMDQSMALSVVETKQGMFKEYSVDTDKEADAKLDAIRKTYKSADETDEGKGKVRY